MSQIEKTRAEIILEQQAEIADLKRQLEEVRNVCAEMYQVLGAYGAPDNILDNVLAAAECGKIPHETVLPFTPTVEMLPDWLTNTEARKDTERRIEEYQRKTILPPCESISMRHLDRRGRVSKGIIKMLGGCSCDNCLDLERGAIDAARAEGKDRE